MTELKKAIRVGIASSIDPALFRHFPSEAEVIRYSVDGDETYEVDLLVAPSFGKQAADVFPRVRTRYIQTISAGVETVQPVVPPGVVLLNAKGIHDRSTAEWAVTAILASLKWLPFYEDLRRQSQWVTSAASETYWQQTYGQPHGAGTPILLEELAEKSVLIVGYGSIGKAIETRLLPFEPREVVRLARTAREDERGPIHGFAELHRLLPEADIVVLITPLTAETRHLIGAAELALMRRGTILVNAARGGVVETDALVSALEAHQVRAALDVTDPEPLPAEHPLWRAPGLLLTPHIAGSTPLFLDRVFRFVGRQLQHILDGEEPENIIKGTY